MATRRRPSRRIDAQRIDLQRGVAQLAQSIREIEISLRRAEEWIETDARDRIRQLRAGAREQLLVLRGHGREAMAILLRLSGDAPGSWAELERQADRALKDAGEIADSIVERCRRILSESRHGDPPRSRRGRPDR